MLRETPDVLDDPGLEYIDPPPSQPFMPTERTSPPWTVVGQQSQISDVDTEMGNEEDPIENFSTTAVDSSQHSSVSSFTERPQSERSVSETPSPPTTRMLEVASINRYELLAPKDQSSTPIKQVSLNKKIIPYERKIS